MRNLKSEKGAITVLILITILFLTTFLISSYIIMSNKMQSQREVISDTKELYGSYDINQIYNSYFANDNAIPIYTVEQLLKIGNNENVTINGKIYKFLEESTYVLMNDLVFDVSNYSSVLGTDTDWTPIGKTNYKFEGNNHTITVTQSNGEIIYCTEYNGYTGEKISISAKVGDYINYTPTEGIYEVTADVSGYTATQSFSTQTGSNALKWRILSINGSTGEIKLVAENQTSSKLYLGGANGYNHGVDILNDFCKNMYSNPDLGATARSINVDDINKKTTFNKATYTNYGTVFTPSNKKYPNLYMAEIGSTSEGLNGTGLTESKGVRTTSGEADYETYNGINTASTLYVTFTYYYYSINSYLNENLGKNSAPLDLLQTGTTYWLASRCCKATSGYGSYSIRSVSSDGNVMRLENTSETSYESMMDSSGAFRTNGISVRPVVTIILNKDLTLDEENSTDSIKYWNI